MVEAVIFDMDGTLLDSQRVWDTLWAPALEPFGLVPDPGFVADTRGTAGQATLDVTHRYYGEDADAEGILKRAYDLADEYFCTTPVPLKEGSREILDYLGEKGVPCAVASSSPIHVINGALGLAGIDGYFDHVVCTADVERPKPAPDIFLEAARRLASDPACTIVVEDSFAGVMAARAGGFISVMVPDMAQPDESLDGQYDLLCESLLEVRDAIDEGRLG